MRTYRHRRSLLCCSLFRGNKWVAQMLVIFFIFFCIFAVLWCRVTIQSFCTFCFVWFCFSRKQFLNFHFTLFSLIRCHVGAGDYSFPQLFSRNFAVECTRPSEDESQYGRLRRTYSAKERAYRKRVVVPKNDTKRTYVRSAFTDARRSCIVYIFGIKSAKKCR